MDVGDDAIRMIQLDGRSGRVRAAAMIPTGSGPGDDRPSREALRLALRRGGFTGSTCVVGAPRNSIHIHPIRVPEMPAGELLESLAWEASERFDIPRESLRVDGIRTGARYAAGDADRPEVVLFALDERRAGPWLDLLLDCGLAPLALEPGFCGTARAHSARYRRDRDRERCHVIIDVGHLGSTLMYLRGDRIGFCKTIPVGGDGFDRALARTLEIDDRSAQELRRDRRTAHQEGRTLDPAVETGADDALKPLIHDLASEIALCLRHCAVAFRGTRPEQILLSGPDAAEPGLAPLVLQRTGLEVVFDDAPGNVARLADDFVGLGLSVSDAPAWIAATGLALRERRVRSTRNGRAA